MNTINALKVNDSTSIEYREAVEKELVAKLDNCRDPLNDDASFCETAGTTLTPRPSPFPANGRQLVLTPASDIKPENIRWLWDGYVPLSELTLLGGREGIGKSMASVRIAADVTRGRLGGVYFGTPRSVILAATEDSWSYTIVPRLLAAGADLSRVFRVDAQTAESPELALCLPDDLVELERLIGEHDVALVILDPLMSRLNAGLDTHKDSEVRKALEPLVALLHRTDTGMIGLIHVNKSGSNDPLNSLMGSRAWTAVPRSVLFVMVDPDDEHQRLLGQTKSNLGPDSVPMLKFEINSVAVSRNQGVDVMSGRLDWLGEDTRSIRQALTEANAPFEDRTCAQEAGEWLADYLAEQGGTASSKAIKDAGRKAGHSEDALKRARVQLRVRAENRGFPRHSYWILPSQSEPSSQVQSSQVQSGSVHPTAPTAPTAPTGAGLSSRETSFTNNNSLERDRPVSAVGAVGAVGGTLQSVTSLDSTPLAVASIAAKEQHPSPERLFVNASFSGREYGLPMPAAGPVDALPAYATPAAWGAR